MNLSNKNRSINPITPEPNANGLGGNPALVAPTQSTEAFVDNNGAVDNNDSGCFTSGGLYIKKGSPAPKSNSICLGDGDWKHVNEDGSVSFWHQNPP